MLLLLLFLFQIGISLVSFLQVWEELPKFKFFMLNLKGENFFIIDVVFGKFWLTMCLLVVCRNYLDIVHLIIHIAFHLHNCIV
jgi:hypothetical protein